MLKEINVREILRQSEVQSMPEFYFGLADLPDEEIAAAISEHAPALQSRFLNIFSVFYQRTPRAKTIAEAVLMAGPQQSIDLVLAIILADLFRPLGPDIVSRDAFWRHSVACGVAARALAERCKEKNVERYFVAGLLHDVGSLLIYTTISEKSLLAILRGRDVESPLYELESKVIGFDHAQLGAEVLRTLKLPEWIQEAVGHHHAPELALNYPTEAAVVHVADIIANAMKFGTRGEYKVPPLTPSAWEVINLPPSVIGEVIQQVDQLTGSVIKHLLVAP